MTFDELVEVAGSDEAVVGLVLTGSCGRGFAVTEGSDWDVRLVVRDDVRDEYRASYGTPHGLRVEIVVLGLAEFRNGGAIGSPSEWDRYSYVDATVVVDRADALLARLVAEKSMLPVDAARAIAAERLDDYVNACYRAAKNARSGLEHEAVLDAAESIPPLLDCLFAMLGASARSTASWGGSSSRSQTRPSGPAGCSSDSRRSVRATSPSSSACSATSRPWHGNTVMAT